MAGNDNKLVTLADLGAAYTALSATATTSANGMMSSTDKTKLEGIESGAQVNSITGVKGDSENDYRTGNVNITPANIGAVSTSSIANNLTTITTGSVLDATQGKALKDDVDSKLSKDFSTYTIATTPYNNNTLIPLRLGDDNLVTDFGTLSTQLGGGGGTNQGALVHYTAQYGPFGTSGQSSTLNTTVNDSNVTADMCVLKAVFSNPSAQTSDWTVTCSHNGTTGQVNFQGGITGTTNVTLYFGVAMTAAPSLLVNLGSNNSDNILKASVSPGVTGVLGVANGGTGANTPNGALDALGLGNYFYSTLFRRNRIYTCDSTSDCIFLIIGKYGELPIFDIALKNGGTPYIYHYGEAKNISVSNDSNNKFTITIPNYYDGRMLSFSTNAVKLIESN